jgi:pyrroline-5-carboxylate reductase
MQHKKITFIGAGNMAGSIISGLVKDGYPADFICASDPSVENTQKLSEQYAIQGSQDNVQAAKRSEVVVLAVKPQLMADVCQTLVDQGVDFSDKLVISIAAGVSVQRLQSLLGENTAVAHYAQYPFSAAERHERFICS